jgi:hypothetical protein
MGFDFLLLRGDIIIILLLIQQQTKTEKRCAISVVSLRHRPPARPPARLCRARRRWVSYSNKKAVCGRRFEEKYYWVQSAKLI